MVALNGLLNRLHRVIDQVRRAIDHAERIFIMIVQLLIFSVIVYILGSTTTKLLVLFISMLLAG